MSELEDMVIGSHIKTVLVDGRFLRARADGLVAVQCSRCRCVVRLGEACEHVRLDEDGTVYQDTGEALIVTPLRIKAAADREAE